MVSILILSRRAKYSRRAPPWTRAGRPRDPLGPILAPAPIDPKTDERLCPQGRGSGSGFHGGVTQYADPSGQLPPLNQIGFSQARVDGLDRPSTLCPVCLLARPPRQVRSRRLGAKPAPPAASYLDPSTRFARECSCTCRPQRHRLASRACSPCSTHASRLRSYRREPETTLGCWHGRTSSGR